MFVVPKTGFIVRDPRTMQAMPPEGLDIPVEVTGTESYWLRRVEDGDVTIGAPLPVSPKKEAK